MAKIAAKFEDWTPPWGDGEIDEDKTAKLIYNLMVSEQEKVTEVRDLKAANKELTDANEVFKAASDEAEKEHSTEVEKAVAAEKKRTEQETARADAAEKTNWKLQAQVKFPDLEDADFKRISGKNLEEFLEDAEEFASIKAPKEAPKDPDDTVDPDDSTIELNRRPRQRRVPNDPAPRETSADAQEKKLLADVAAGSLW